MCTDFNLEKGFNFLRLTEVTDDPEKTMYMIEFYFPMLSSGLLMFHHKYIAETHFRYLKFNLWDIHVKKGE